jgi:hypothetical protein
MQRRTLLRLSASAVAVAALGGGAWIQRQRAQQRRQSDTIMGPWGVLGPGVSWLLPDLDGARMVVPDRPHGHNEDDDPQRRNAIRRVRRFRVSTGPQRLRGGSFSRKPAEGVTRILALGDSTTFGWGVEDHESWPARLQARLGERGLAVELLNAGVPSQGIAGMAAYLLNVGADLGLHGVIFSRRPDPQRPGEYREAIRACRDALPGLRTLVALAPVGRFDATGKQRWEEESAKLERELAPMATPVLELTGAFREAQGKRGCDLELAGNTLRVVRLETGEVLLEAERTPQDLPLPIYELLERDHSVAEPLIFDAGHMDAEGNELAAQLLDAYLSGNDWVG